MLYGSAEKRQMNSFLFYSSLVCVCVDLRQRQTRQHHCRRRPSMAMQNAIKSENFSFLPF